MNASDPRAEGRKGRLGRVSRDTAGPGADMVLRRIATVGSPEAPG
jgi:hypothetical protein